MGGHNNFAIRVTVTQIQLIVVVAVVVVIVVVIKQFKCICAAFVTNRN